MGTKRPLRSFREVLYSGHRILANEVSASRTLKCTDPCCHGYLHLRCSTLCDFKTARSTGHVVGPIILFPSQLTLAALYLTAAALAWWLHRCSGPVRRAYLPVPLPARGVPPRMHWQRRPPGMNESPFLGVARLGLWWTGPPTTRTSKN
jgi:hypothetical protein